MDHWTEIELFVRIAESGSLSRAAETLGLSNAAASRHLVALEARLGARLVERNTRRLYLTDVGQAFFQRTKPILLDLKDAEQSANAASLNPSGTLRVTASLSFAVQHLAPVMREYTRIYPEVRVHIEVANRYVDIIDQNIDVAIRTRESEPDSNTTIRRLAETRRILVASPGYLAQHGPLRSLEDLSAHRLLIYTYANNPNELRFSRDGRTTVVQVHGLLESNDGQVLRAAALDGMGVLIQPTYILYEDIVAGRLVPVLDAWDLPRLTINLAYPSRKYLSARVRSFIDFFAAHFCKMDYERKWTARFGAR
ncbi:LysR family transcriptional regulator [Verminephrobacter aporrectodeae]|uniref:LysR family transcriptional regulator n=1 Tax=Verminephrobacter aporrectodeae subsp. tuberculatae TaxID=1110392 RepID=A0ABT3KTI6_9BURK|nr:LysR family transcriptional regulator [Verminephrobacter aporrectodeae]MCW5257252.1 LysR family transcriptional regulator [Verminephrobacter aporrectodeae subsp. tuberculatae]MCW5321565.1 LysR family transcriptional regulator [Verminephrobacter aporrectodeae subsp. tuberculatae]MCW8174992.1 LysR family transcriptional regulator [Verminephrobacter aporrectodeae subsp. tuberculatae]MCW8201589.1 LysR family transcriptional regulator [Verminephrobacter aporrectodeae subsp. tuberculatae]MCW82057